MKKAPLYSRSRTLSRGTAAGEACGIAPTDAAAAAIAASAAPGPRRSRFVAWIGRHERRLWAGALLLTVAAAALTLQGALGPRTPALTMKQIDAAMRHSIEETPLRSPEAGAYEAILPAVVRVVGLMTEGDDGNDHDDNDNAGKSHPTVERGVAAAW